MAHIVIATKGTMGDLVPFVSLGRRLTELGHDILFAVNSAMMPVIERAGLKAAPVGAPLDEVVARRHAEAWDDWLPTASGVDQSEKLAADIRRDFTDLLPLVERADLLVASVLQGAAPMIHSATAVPWLSVAPNPGLFEAANSPEALTPAALRALKPYLFEHNLMRRRLGFHPLSFEEWTALPCSTDLVLLASSEHFSAPPTERYPQVRQTGFWFNNVMPDRGELSSELEEFMMSDEPPLVLTFSSLPVTNPDRVVSQHVEAALLLGRRIVVQRGWANFGLEHVRPGLPTEHVYWADYVPHAQLFPLACAVAHHGGILTTAEAMRAGCPMLVEPYGNDQHFNALRVVQLGLGSAMHPHKLTAQSLARVLEEKVLSNSCGARMADVAPRVREEDGIGRACELVDSVTRGCQRALADPVNLGH